MVFQQFPFEPQGNPDKPLPDNIAANGILIKDKNADVLPPPGINPAYPIPELTASAVGIGHLNAQQDVDGATRTEHRAPDRALLRPVFPVAVADAGGEVSEPAGDGKNYVWRESDTSWVWKPDYPTDNKTYTWNLETGSWVEVTGA